MKTVFTIIAGIFILLIIIVLCLPTFFSSNAGKKMLIGMVEKRSGFQLQIDKLSLGWFSSQKIQGIRAVKTEEKLVATIQEIDSSASLWKIAFMKDLGQVQIVGFDLKMAKPFNPAAAKLKPKTLSQSSFVPQIALAKIELPVKGHIEMKEGKVTFNPPVASPISFDHLWLILDLKPNEELALNLQGTTSPQGKIAVKATATQLKSSYPNVTADATIEQLPVQGIDQLVSLFHPEYNGLIYDFLGPTANLGCHLTTTAGNFDLRLNVASPQVSAYAATQSQNGILSLKGPAEFNFTLTPALLKKLSKIYSTLPPFALANPVAFKTTIEQFSYPALDIHKASLQASFNASDMQLTLGDRTIFVSGLNLNANSSSLAKDLNFNLSAGLQKNGSLNVQGNVQSPLSANKTGDITVQAKGLPTDLLSGFVANSGDLLGPSADIDAKLTFHGNDNQFHLRWASDNLQIPNASFSFNDTLALQSPTTFTFIPNPKWVNGLGFSLIKATPIQGTIKTVSVPLNNFQNSVLEISLSEDLLALGGAFPLTIQKLQAALSVNTLQKIGLQLDSDPIKLALAGSYANGAFTLTKPLAVQCAVTPQMLKTLMPTAPAELVKPSTFQLSLNPMTIPLQGASPLRMKMSGQITNPELVLRTQGRQVALQNTSLPFQWDGIGKTASLQLSSEVNSNGSLQGQFNLTNFSTDKGLDLSKADLQGTLDAQNLSTALLDIFAKQGLSEVVGPAFNTQLKLQSTPDKQTLGVKWTSQNLKVDTGFTLNNELQLQGANNQIVLTLTPASYKALDTLLAGQTQEAVPFTIKEPSTLTLTLSKLSLPAVRNPQSRIPQVQFDLSKLQINLTGKDPSLTFYDQTLNETIQLQNLSFSLNKTPANPLVLSMDTMVKTEGANIGTKNGSLSVNGKLLPNPDLSKLTASLYMKAQQFPSRALDILARAKGRTDSPFTKVFGNTINAATTIDLENFTGPISLSINSPLVRVSLDGALKSGVLTLKDTLRAQVKLTKENSRLFLDEANPLDLTYMYSQDPITLEIPAAGFSCPLHPSDLAKVNIPKGNLELGKINCSNEGNINIALGLLKARQTGNNGELMLWFAPLDFSVKEGLVDIERTELLLADTYDLCFWGKVNMVTNELDMVLGLTAQALSKAFVLKNLPENYVLWIPMRGKADNVKIDSGKATAKIALLLASQQAEVSGALGSNPAGMIIGGLLKKAITLPDSKEKTPPAKHPFPWETGKAKPAPSSHTNEKKFKANDKPLKQILKLMK